MKNGGISLLILILLFSFYFYESSRNKQTRFIKIYVCKDKEARIFFMGKEQDLNNIILKSGIMKKKSCSPKKMTPQEWETIKKRLKHRNMTVF